MSTYGFQLETLQVTGQEKPEATLNLRGGLNVVAGPSNTGKSYIFSCINFMLGGSTPPKKIEAAKGYNMAYLTIRPGDGQPLTFERALKGGAFRLFEGDLESIGRVEGRIISEEHNADNDDNISSLLLKLCGLGRKTILKNQGGVTRSLSFRDVVKFVLVHETRILIEGSPILTEKLLWSPEKTTFKLLITGEDSSGIIVQQASDVVRAQRQGQLDLVNELIANAEAELTGLTTDAAGVEEQARKANAAIEQLASSLAEKQAEISDQELVRRTSYETVQQLDSRRLTIRELRSRFELLRERYNSDLERLGSIREANRLFFELSPHPCPLCGSDGQPIEGVSKDQIENACSQEIRKIHILLNDLSQTTTQLAEEGKQLDQQRTAHQNRFNSASRHIQQVLLPTARQSHADIQQLIATLERLERAKQLLNQLSVLKDKRATLSQPLPKRPRLATPAEIRTSEFEGLCQEIEALLNAWRYPDAGAVRFSESDQDIVIANRDRKSPGKGFRALSYAAFTIGLMKFCRKAGLPHPGFVVLDSPLVAYKDPDVGDETITNNNVKDAFYRTLTNTPLDEQIIILENENPPEDIRDSMNFVHFTRLHGVRRYGFFPVSDQEAAPRRGQDPGPR